MVLKLNITFRTLEVYIKKKNCFPKGKKFDKLIKIITKDCLPNFSKLIIGSLKNDSKSMLKNQRSFQNKFEYRLYRRWEEPIDLLECLIRGSMEGGESHKNILEKTADKTNNFKREALIKIHARAIQISNEILILVKSGYADGAYARWRNLHELAVISFFLLDNDNNVSQRYLEHAIVKRYKEAKDYRECYKKLGYPPIQRKEFNKLKREHDKLISKYGNEFKYSSGYEWIPKIILRDRNFRSLEKHVKLGKLRIFYSLSCNTVHGGASEFYPFGVMDRYQDKVLLVGASNYGLADPIQNTTISLSHITVCLLCLEPDFQDLINMHIITNYINEIGPISVKVQKLIEEDEKD